MRPDLLINTVTEAVKLDRKIAELQEKLKELKAVLIIHANGRPEEQTKTEGGGNAWSAEGNDGCIARVNFPAPALKGKIDGAGKTIEKIQEIAGKWFHDLFDQAPAYKMKAEFRDLAEKFLGPFIARKLIKLCSVDSSPRVSFETKEIKQ